MLALHTAARNRRPPRQMYTILAALEQNANLWVDRRELGRLIGRPHQRINPNDIKALDHLLSIEAIESRQSARGVPGKRWEYRIKRKEVHDHRTG